jgi:peptide/nickel transport system substrate-binding protein
VKTTVQTRALLALAAAFGLAAAACGGGAPSNQAPAPQASATENQINPLPRDQVRDGGTLTWPLDQMPVNFNYNQIDGTEWNGFYVIRAMMPWPFLSDAHGDIRWNPNYLASKPTLVTDPKQVVTLEINPKATWSDGTPITWQDFYWQWKAVNGANPAYHISGANGYEDIESVARGKDDREVVITFARHFADWQSLFGPLYPSSTDRNPALFNDGWKARFLQSAGPFKLDSINQTTKTLTAVRDPKWWGPPAKLDRIVFRVIDPDAQIDALANGEVDFMEIASDVDKYQRALRIPDVDIRVAGGPNFSHITFNGAGEILSDLRVRQAVAMAIDRSAVTRSLLGPLNLPTTTLGNHLFMLNQTGYRDNSGEVGTYNPDKAKTLLDEAGWALNGSVRMKNGKPLQLTLIIPTGIATSRQVGELIQNMLAAVGVKLVITAVPGDDFFDKYITAGQYDLTFFSWMGTPFPISSAKSVYVKPTRDARGRMHIQQNYARIGSDAIDRLFDQANAELDRAKAIEIANQADALIWQEVHSMTLYQRPELFATKKDLANFGARGFADIIYEDIGWKK